MKKENTNKDRISKIANVLWCSMFCILFLFAFVFNIDGFKNAIVIERENEGNVQKKAAAIESSFRDNLRWKRQFASLYGLTLKLFDWRVVGNCEFVKDDQNIMQLFVDAPDPTDFVKSMDWLKETTQKARSPLIYVTWPDKSQYLPLAKSEQFHFSGQMSTRFAKLIDQEIDRISVEEEMQRRLDAPSFEDFFFKTDVHYSTYGEFWTAHLLETYLAEKYGLTFYNADAIFDLSNYDILDRGFIGNTARSVGEYFVGLDCFQMYLPKFETDLTLIDPTSSTEITGTFENIALSGYEHNEQADQYTYWVTNFGRYPSPYYQYINNSAPDDCANVLLITDSTFMRGLSYLALSCKSVSVLDPRFFNGTNYLTDLLSTSHYDAVVVIGSEFFGVALLQIPLDDYQAKIESYYWNNNQLNVTVRNTSSVTWQYTDQVKLGIFSDGIDTGIRGYISPNQSVEKGEAVVFSISFEGKEQFLMTNLEATMLQEGITYFGEKTAVTYLLS